VTAAGAAGDDELNQLRTLVHDFAEHEVRPLAQRMDRDEYFPRELFGHAGRLGLIGACLPLDYGGGGLDLAAAAIIREELARASAAFAAIVAASGVYFGLNVARHGTAAQKARYLPAIAAGEAVGAWALTEPSAGSDGRGIATTTSQTAADFVVNGSKTFTTNGPVADYVIVQTRREGLGGGNRGTAVILERGMQGLQFGPPIEKLGLRGSPTGDIYMDNVTITADHILGDDGAALDAAFNNLDAERILVLFSGLGIARACLDEVVRYSAERRQFGRPIASFQLIKEKIALISATVEVIRAYGAFLLSRHSLGLSVRKEAAVGKYLTAEAVMRCAIEAVQVFGGYGFTKEFVVERLMRDAKLLAIGGGTTEMQKLVIARETFAEYGVTIK
jgi:isovaleryl-CoA dehydrogenase